MVPLQGMVNESRDPNTPNTEFGVTKVPSNQYLHVELSNGASEYFSPVTACLYG